MRLAVAGIVLVAVAGYSYGVYSLGSISGAEKVTLQWDKENKIRDERTRELELENSQLSTKNQVLSEQISKELADYDARHKIILATINADNARRLRLSETRAGVYRQQAEGDATERERLASHAAELDRSLEEGRHLVRELGATIRLREDQIRKLSEQILADRALLN